MFKIIGATVVYGFAGFGLYRWLKEYRRSIDSPSPVTK